MNSTTVQGSNLSHLSCPRNCNVKIFDTLATQPVSKLTDQLASWLYPDHHMLTIFHVSQKKFKVQLHQLWVLQVCNDINLAQCGMPSNM